jgi:hypothetical protein
MLVAMKFDIIRRDVIVLFLVLHNHMFIKYCALQALVHIFMTGITGD